MNDWTPHWIMRLLSWSEDSWFSFALTVACVAGIVVATYLLATGQ